MEDDTKALEGLRGIYKDNIPIHSEFVVSAGCYHSCAHCIYPPDYDQYTTELPPSTWLEIALQLIRTLNMKTFVYSGRSLTSTGVQFLADLRKAEPDIQIGVIDNGHTCLEFREELAQIHPDWIDISLDGLEPDHDRQRRKTGSYRQALSSAMWFKENSISPKVNILTCLTTINRDSVLHMIREVNGLGFKIFL